MANRNVKKGKGVLAFVFCIPLAFILYFWIIYSSQSINVNNIHKITVTSPDESVMVFEDSENIEFFVNMLNRAHPINIAMRDVSGETPVKITCDRKDKLVEYELYPSLNFSGCLLVGPEEKLYALETEVAKELLLRNEFEYLYSEYFLPTLYVVSGEEKFEVTPVEGEWQFIKADDKFYDFVPSQFAKGDEKFVVRQGFENSLTFNPDSETRPYDIKISCVAENGMEYDIDDISDLNLSVDTLLKMKISASWDSKGGAKAYGKAEYEFDLLYDIPATVEFKDTVVEAGGFLELSATHLNEDELVEIKADGETYKLDFEIISDDKGIVLLPVELGTTPGTYNIEVVAGANVKEETITVKANGNDKQQWITVGKDDYLEHLSRDAIEELYNSLGGVVKDREGKYFTYGTDKLKAPVKNTDIKTAFATEVIFGGEDISSVETGDRICNGVVYNVKKDTSVRSAQSGVVVFCGNLKTVGNAVIIYHGYGIYSYYYHLDTSDLKAGDSVGDNEIIGVAGQTGFTNKKTAVHFAVSINGTFVDPELFIG